MQPFIVGKSNQRALAAIQGSARVVWLYGPTDTGKSFLAGKCGGGSPIIDPATSENVTWQMLDDALARNMRVIMVAAKPPREVLTCPKALSRVACGAIVGCAPWTEEMRRRYFIELTGGARCIPRQRRGTVRSLLLKAVTGGPRVLNGLATAWQTMGYSTDKNDLAKLITSYGARHVWFRGYGAGIDHAQMILRAVADYYGTSVEWLEGNCKTKNVAHPRHVYIALARERCKGLTLREIGSLIGGRDHSTVLHAVNKMRERLNAGQASELEEINAIIERQLHEQSRT